jgi:serine/threonine-protein kinase
MAEVYRGVDTRLGNRIVAIKTLSADVSQHKFAERMRNLFIQEAQALSLVKDDNVVDVLDFGVSVSGTPYMVMEFLRGTDLAGVLKKTQRLPVAQAVDIMLGVCAGVHACHLAGIIHRDLKPANIFLARTAKGAVAKVLDFSVAKVPIARATPSLDQARTDLIVGTPTYMSPEQALGRPANERSDQYSLGGLLFRCLTGRPPQGVLPVPRELRPEIPEALQSVVLRALEAQPEKRFATVHDLGQGLVPFGSLRARERWRPYYEAVPRVIDPTTTGSIAFSAPYSAGGGTRWSRSMTVAATPGACRREPSTVVDLPTPGSSQREPATQVESATEVWVRAQAPSTPVPMALHDKGRLGEPRLDVIPSDAVQATIEDEARSPSTMRIRRPGRFGVGLGLLAILVVVVTVTAIRRTRGTGPATPAVTVPAWVGRAGPAAAAPRAAAAVHPSPQSGAGVALEAPPSAESPSVQPALAPEPDRPMHRHARRSVTETIEFGAGGIPILP